MPYLEIEDLTMTEIRKINKQLTERLTEIENKILPKELEKQEEPPPEYWETMYKENEESIDVVRENRKTRQIHTRWLKKRI